MNNTPELVYRLATDAQWRRAQISGVISYELIDKRDGFFHLSTREQMFETARLYFSGEASMLALEFSKASITTHLKWEAVSQREDDLFPHYYGELKTNAVARVHLLRRSSLGDFEFDDEVLP